MKLTQEQKEVIKSEWGDWETVHALRDEYVMTRIKEIDPEFYEDIEKITEGAEFWYA